MKISIIGRGNAGCINAIIFAHYRNLVSDKIEIDLYFDSSIPPVPTGQATTLDLTEILFNKFNMSIINDLPHTIKTGIMYENFGKKQDQIFAHFPFGSYAIHLEPKSFQDFVCRNLDINFQEIDENITNYDEIDSDFIIDCRGTPQDFNEYEKLTNPVNSALLSFLPKKEKEVNYTKSIAHKNGWCFYIPLPDKTSLGYLFNKNVTSEQEAKLDFEESFGVEGNSCKNFSFDQYIAKSPILNDRVMLNGNRLFFLEPLEATAMACYIKCSRFYFDYILGKSNKEKVNNEIKDYVSKLEDFILWHYSAGSKFETKFWSFAHSLWENHDTSRIKHTIKRVSKMSSQNIEKTLYSGFKYAQWEEWNFKGWLDGIK